MRMLLLSTIFHYINKIKYVPLGSCCHLTTHANSLFFCSPSFLAHPEGEAAVPVFAPTYYCQMSMVLNLVDGANGIISRSCQRDTGKYAE